MSVSGSSSLPDLLNGVIRAGAAGAGLASVILALDTRADWGGLPALVIPLFLFVSATGFIVANAIAGALGCFPERAGATSSLIGATRYGTGVLGAALVGVFANGTPGRWRVQLQSSAWEPY